MTSQGAPPPPPGRPLEDEEASLLPAPSVTAEPSVDPGPGGSVAGGRLDDAGSGCDPARAVVVDVVDTDRAGPAVVAVVEPAAPFGALVVPVVAGPLGREPVPPAVVRAVDGLVEDDVGLGATVVVVVVGGGPGSQMGPGVVGPRGEGSLGSAFPGSSQRQPWTTEESTVFSAGPSLA